MEWSRITVLLVMVAPDQFLKTIHALQELSSLVMATKAYIAGDNQSIFVSNNFVDVRDNALVHLIY